MATSRTRGQHAGLTRQAILQAAVRIADREGSPALSMRRLGAELGVEAMALYHYVPNKEALLDGVIEEVATEVPVPSLTAAGWQNGAETLRPGPSGRRRRPSEPCPARPLSAG